MKRFFFDYRTKDQSVYDYQGDEFLSAQSAIEFAHATAQVLTHSLSGDWAGWSIEVRNPEGMKLFSVAVDSAGALAA